MVSRLKLVVMLCLMAVPALFVHERVAAQRGDSRQSAQRSTGGIGITIFAQPEFRGQNATFRDNVPDLRRYNMNDRVDSLQIGRGETWEVCEDINYKGRCRVFTGDEPDLGRISWGGLVSSLRKLADNDRRGGGRDEFPPPGLIRSRLVLFDQTEFRGRSFVMSGTTPSFRELGNRARSAKVYGGSWELCDGPQFRGRCVTLNGSEPDLGRVGLRDKVSSARPLIGRR